MIDCARRWNVLIVEDDLEIGDLHRRIVDKTADFDTILVVRNGERALDAARRLPVDVAIVDLSMPGGDGMTFLRRLRAEGIDIDAIVVTATRDGDTVREAMHLGVFDYLVKPFAPERLRQSLEAYARRIRTLRRGQVAQADLDLVQANGATMHRLPKGLRPGTLDVVQRTLRASSTGLSADELGRVVGASRVTARRYLEYLNVMGVATMDEDCGRPGRPKHRYRWRGANAA